MALNIQLNETQIKITGENNEKLVRILENPALKKIKLDKKNMINTLIEGMSEDEIIRHYKRAIGIDVEKD